MPRGRQGLARGVARSIRIVGTSAAVAVAGAWLTSHAAGTVGGSTHAVTAEAGPGSSASPATDTSVAPVSAGDSMAGSVSYPSPSITYSAIAPSRVVQNTGSAGLTQTITVVVP